MIKSHYSVLLFEDRLEVQISDHAVQIVRVHSENSCCFGDVSSSLFHRLNDEIFFRLFYGFVVFGRGARNPEGD